jgi:nucleotide-binding universal stress UspA family protein
MAGSAAPSGNPVQVRPDRERPEAVRRILVPLDGSDLATAALGPAARLARDLGTDVVLMTAARPARVPGVEPDLALELGETDALFLLTGAASSGALEGLPITRLVTRGELAESPAEAILTAARDVNAGLIVMATHGRSGVRRAILGSVADAVVARAEVPVLLIPPHRRATDGEPAPGAGRLLVALDGSAAAAAALGPAAALSAGLGIPIDLARVVAEATPSTSPGEEPARPDGDAAASLEAAELRLGELGVPARRRRSAILRAQGRRVADALLAYAEKSRARMLIVATHARRGLDRLRHGSVEADVLGQATLPVLVVRVGGPAVPPP